MPKKTYRVVRIVRGKYTTYKMCETLEEATRAMSNLNQRLLNKAYDRAIEKGRRGLRHGDYASALRQTAIQY